MPQMAPLNWLLLFLCFSTILILFNIMNYFIFQYPIKVSPFKKIKTQMNWKW